MGVKASTITSGRFGQLGVKEEIAMESIKDKVAIVGMGCTQFGELWNKSADDLITEAADEALTDAGIELKDIQAAWVGTATNYTGGALSRPLKLQYLPVTHVENACATGTDAIRNAAFAIAAKVYDLVLVVTYEKLKDIGWGGLPMGPRRLPVIHPVYEATYSGAAVYALAASRYFYRYNSSPEEGKLMLAKVSVKSHHNGARNPRAHLRREITIEDVMKAPIIAWPLGLYDCCGITDGAAAAVLCRTEDARQFRDDYVTIKGISISVGPLQGNLKSDYDFTHWEETEVAARQAYDMAGIRNPRKELDLAEVHDCFSISEVIACESLGFCNKGQARYEIDEGVFTQEGELPVNLSGGLKSFGHPIGASGCREIYEIYKQVQGKAEDPSRQLKDVKLGLTHSQGGTPGKFMCAVSIIGAP
jgi:acetyl-CoA C-acetyltransferase